MSKLASSLAAQALALAPRISVLGPVQHPFIWAVAVMDGTCTMETTLLFLRPRHEIPGVAIARGIAG